MKVDVVRADVLGNLDCPWPDCKRSYPWSSALKRHWRDHVGKGGKVNDGEGDEDDDTNELDWVNPILSGYSGKHSYLINSKNGY